MNTKSIDVYYPQTILNRNNELEKYAKQNAINTRKEALEEKKRKSDAKIARMIATKEDKYFHTVELIIEYAKSAKSSETTQYANNGTNFSIPYYFFNFDDHIRARDLLESFLVKLKSAGCFSDFKRSPMTFWGFDIVFSGVNIESLYKYENTLRSRNTDQSMGKAPININEEKLSCGNLTYNMTTSELTYKGNTKEISPETREMKFFLSLYKHKNQTVEYKDIARDVNIHSYEETSEKFTIPHENLQNKDFAEAVSFLRRDFKTITLELGMANKEFSSMIKTFTKSGYKLICK